MIYSAPGHYGDVFMTTRRRTVYSPKAYDDLYVPTFVYPRHRIDTTGEENAIRRSVNDELVYTTHVVDDTYDLAAKSRNRDQEILRDANRAIPPSSTEQSLPTASLKASAPPKPFRRFLDANSGRSHSQGNFEWKSPAARAYFNARDIRNSTFAPSSSSILSPYESPRSTPERDLGVLGRRKKHKVLGSKIRVGKFNRKYPDKRSRRPPELYYDADSTLSDGAEEYGSDDDYQEYANDDDDVYSSNGEYYLTRERSPSPSDYVPFTPRRMLTYEEPEDDVGYGSKLGSLPDLSVQPYYSRRCESGDEGVADDILFHNVVAQTAAKARAALRDVNLDEFENASIVLSVEGEMKDPRKGGEALGFQYISRPIPLKGPMLATGPGSYAATSGTDSAFDKYFSEMRSFREQIRQRLESGYQALRDASTTYRSKYYGAHKALPYHSSSISYDRPRDKFDDIPSYESSYSPLKYRKRLEDESEDRLLLYPVSQRDSLPALPSTEPSYGTSEKMELCEFGNELRLSTLDKIKIKAALVGNKVEVVLPAGHRKRPKSKYAADVMREINLKKAHETTESVDVTPVETSHMHASSRPVSEEPSKSKDDYKPMSDVRRRVRRVICKNRNDPKYFKN